MIKRMHFTTLFAAILLSTALIFAGTGVGIAADCTNCHSLYSQNDYVGLDQIVEQGTVTNAYEAQFCAAPSAKQGFNNFGTILATNGTSAWNGVFLEGNGTTHHSQAWQIDATKDIGMAGDAVDAYEISSKAGALYQDRQVTSHKADREAGKDLTAVSFKTDVNMMIAGAAGLATGDAATFKISHKTTGIGDGASTFVILGHDDEVGGEFSIADFAYLPGTAVAVPAIYYKKIEMATAIRI